ncbi:NUDIX hydrolase [Ornithinibacillus scapharcae]|uniref:NUDIX hydrolase n=1 Tax=Ornithinibacillus scapharcae TaxID=1147159 RepID=UPI000225AD05|nr:NUDIX hydrolase [Ornithinibacillus scapharcae]
MKKFEEKSIHSEEIFNGKVISLQIDDVLLPNGNKAKRELVKHPGAVGIIPITQDNKIVLVEQYRKPLEKPIIEIPAGKMEPGEAPELTALRELEEETGYTTKSLDKICSFYTSPGFADEIMHIYLARDIEKLENPPSLDEDEFVEILEMTLEEAKKYVLEERIHDAKTNYAILYLEMQELL